METNSPIIYTNLDDVPEMYGLTYCHPNIWLSKYKDTSFYVWSVGYESDINSFDKNAIFFVKQNKNAKLFLTNTPEGYVYHNLKVVYELVSKFGLHNKVIYGVGNPDAKLEYQDWLEKKNLPKIFDVYFHSFWFSEVRQNLFDCEYDFSIDKTKWFCCLNNRPHPHRQQTVTYLDYLNLLDKGIVTCLDTNYEPGVDKFPYKNIVLSYTENYNDKFQLLDTQKEITGKKLPLNFDTEDYSEGSRPHDYNPNIYNTCLINLVTETWYHKIWSKKYHNFLSEKIWKPMVAKQIFILIGPQYSLKYLKDNGFKTFDKYIDESYDNLEDNERLFAAVDSLNAVMKKYTIQELSDLTKDIREYNLELLKSGVPALQPKLQSVLCT